MLRGGPETMLPVTVAGVVAPPPVPNTETTEPAFAGLDGELMVPSSLRMAPCDEL